MTSVWVVVVSGCQIRDAGDTGWRGVAQEHREVQSVEEGAVDHRGQRCLIATSVPCGQIVLALADQAGTEWTED